MTIRLGLAELDVRTGDAAVRALQELVELARSARDESLTDVLQAVATAIVETSGFTTACLNLYRPAWNDYQAVIVEGNEEARRALLGTSLPAGDLPTILADEEPMLPGTYFLTAESTNWRTFPHSYTPELETDLDPDAWQSEDGVIVVLTDTSGAPLGFLSVDEPRSGRRPKPDELRLLRAICAHAEQALESASSQSESAALAAMSAEVLAVSRRLAASASEAELHELLCETIASHMRFERVAVYLRAPGHSFELRATAGWASTGELADALSAQRLHALLPEEQEHAGVWLVTAGELFGAAAVHSVPATYAARSRRNGCSPHGWSEHCLVAPMRDEAHQLAGVIVVEDPVDHLLPSDHHRRLLRVLADHGASASTNLRMRAIQSQLLGLVLVRRDAAALAQTLAEIIEAPVVLLDWAGQAIARASHDGRDVPIPTRNELERAVRVGRGSVVPRGPAVRPLEVGDDIEGYLVVDPAGLAGSDRQMAVEQAVISFVLHLAMRANVEEAEHRFRGSLIDELLAGDSVDQEAFARRARRLGHDPALLTAAIAVEPASTPVPFRRSTFSHLASTVRAAITASGSEAIIAPHAGTVLALITEPGDGGLGRLGERIVSLARSDTRLDVFVGISRRVDDPSGLGRGIREARQSLRAAHTVPQLAPIAIAGELNLHHLILTAPRTDEAVRAAGRLLAPLAEGPARSPQLIETLRVYLDCVGHLQTTAARLDVHVNTLRHRLMKIETLLGLDLRNAPARVDLHLALELMPPDFH
jgi:sugar diacid utilization regulator